MLFFSQGGRLPGRLLIFNGQGVNMAHDIDETIDSNLEKPKLGVVDGQTFQQHSIPDQIAGAMYLKSQNNIKNKYRGMCFGVFSPPGTV